MSTYENADAYWEQVGGKVLGELNRRLSTEEAADLPGTLLMRLVEQYLKYLEKKAAEIEAEADDYLTPLQAIDQEGLPDETKIEILEGYLKQLETDHAEAAARLEQILKGGAGETDQVHEHVASK